MNRARHFLIAILLAMPALAQEAETKKEEGPAEIWTWLNFLILAGGLGYLIVKNLGPFLVSRTAQIQEGLAAGERAKAEADARAAAVQLQLSTLDTEISKLRAEAARDREREVARIQRETEAELNRIQQHTALEIESAGKSAQLEVRRYAARLAIELAEKKLRDRMTGNAQTDLIRNFLDDVADGRAKTQTT